MQSIVEASHESQSAANSIDQLNDANSPRRVGVDIVLSAPLSNRFYRGPSRFRIGSSQDTSDEARARRMARALR